jgi:hypothetical protein
MKKMVRLGVIFQNEKYIASRCMIVVKRQIKNFYFIAWWERVIFDGMMMMSALY